MREGSCTEGSKCVCRFYFADSFGSLKPSDVKKISNIIKRYWNNLQKRDSYQDGILNYYTEKEFSIIKDFYQNKSSIFLSPIIKELDILKSN